LVQEFLAAQSLKILPQAPFGDAVNQFVNKDDKHAMETFVSDSLAGQVKQMLDLDSEEEDLDSAMERYRSKLEQQFKSGDLRDVQRRKVVREKPEAWDSDLDGHWEDQPGVVQVGTTSQGSTARARGQARTQNDEGDDDMLDVEEEEAPAKKVPAKRSTARATKAAPAKKAPPKKAPARGGRGKKAVVEEDEDEEDVVMDDDEPVAAPKRTQPARATARTRQSKLNFSQKANQKAVEISDDEISDDDAFEAMPTTRATRRR
jgi:double-strand break repair protein MRE11